MNEHHRHVGIIDNKLRVTAEYRFFFMAITVGTHDECVDVSLFCLLE